MIRAAFLLVVLVSAVGRAEPPGRAGPPSRGEREAAAREHYRRGMTHYDLAEFDRAIDEFKQAYELSNEAGLLFNLAQAYRLKKDPEAALHFYRTYLELKPRAPNRADVEAQIAKMEQAIKEGPVRPSPPREIETRRELTLVTSPAPSFVSSWRGRTVIALSALSAALLVSSAATGGVALADRGRYDAGCDAGRCDRALFQTGQNIAVATDVLLVLGGSAAVVALVLTLTRPHPARVR